MNFLDILFLIIVGYAVFRGFSAGFSRMIIGIAATILAVLCGFWFYHIPAGMIHAFVKSQPAANLLGFLIVFGLILLAGAVAGRLVAGFFKVIGLSFVDRLLGAGLGFLRGTLLVVAIVAGLTAFAPDPPPSFLVNSELMPYAVKASSALAALAPAGVRQYFHRSLENMEKIWSTDRKEARKRSD